jgi:hypothetical protein
MMLFNPQLEDIFYLQYYLFNRLLKTAKNAYGRINPFMAELDKQFNHFKQYLRPKKVDL